jgi:hypothetical protein
VHSDFPNALYKYQTAKFSLNLQLFVQWQKHLTTEMATKSILQREACPQNDTDDYGEFHKNFHTQEKNK